MTNELFEYEINDNTVTIVKYIGNQADVVIPPYIDGKPVTRIGERAFADCTFLASIVLPDENMDIANDAFDNCPDTQFYAAEPDDDSGFVAESASDNNEPSNNNLNFNFGWNNIAEQKRNSEYSGYSLSTNHSMVEPDDFRQPFTANHCLYPQMRKGALANMLDVFFSNLLFVLIFSFLVIILDILFSAGVSGLITFVLSIIRCLKDPLGCPDSEDIIVFLMTLHIVSVLSLGVFFTGFIRIMYAMALKRPYSWKLFFSGFDSSSIGIAITWILFCVNMFLGMAWFFYGIEIMHFQPVYTFTPLIFINLPIAVYLIAAIVIKAGKRTGLFYALPLVAKEFIEISICCGVFALFSIISLVVSMPLIFILKDDAPFAPTIFSVSTLTTLCVLMSMYFTVMFTKIWPKAFDNSPLKTNPPQESQSAATRTSLTAPSIFWSFTLLGFILISLFIFWNNPLTNPVNSEQTQNIEPVNTEQIQDIDPVRTSKTDLSMLKDESIEPEIFNYGSSVIGVFECKSNETGITIVKFKSNLFIVRIPANINGKPVTVIGEDAFAENNAITHVAIPQSVSDIDSGAFRYCKSLMSVKIPNGVRKISQYAFSGCSSLKSVVISGSDAKIGDSAFSYCSSLKSVVISEGITEIDNSAFSNCSSLTSITIPESVTKIGHSAFSGCSSLKSITIPEGVTKIGISTFSNCSSLKSITIPESVTVIDSSAFSNCSSLKSITIPERVTVIDSSAFSNCSSLKSITIPKYVTKINFSAFSDCSSLTSITIPEGVTEIDFCAFSNCSSLTSITIPESVKVISDSAFSNCSSLTSITIPEGVTEIDFCAFSNCSSLKSITIPKSVTRFGNDVFKGCPKLMIFTPRGSKAEKYAKEHYINFYAFGTFETSNGDNAESADEELNFE